MYPVLLRFGNFEIRSYGLIVALSFFIGIWLSTKEAQRKGLESRLIQDFALYALLGGILGARIYFILFSMNANFSYKTNILYTKIPVFFDTGILEILN